MFTTHTCSSDRMVAGYQVALTAQTEVVCLSGSPLSVAPAAGRKGCARLGLETLEVRATPGYAGNTWIHR